MTIYATPYTTAVGGGFPTDKIKLAITQAHIQSGALSTNAGFFGLNEHTQDWPITLSFVGLGTPEEEEIPYFAHPIRVDMSAIRHREAKDYLVYDFRSFLSTNNGKHGEPVAKNTSELAFSRARLKLTGLWVKGDVMALRYFGTAPLGVYSSWVSENISRRLALDATSQMVIAVVAAAYYNSLFLNADMDETDKQRTVPGIARATRVSGDTVFQILDKIEKLDTLDDFVAAIKTALPDNIRLEALNTGLLVTVLSSMWFGTHAREIAGVAIEHPPTWLALLYAAFTERMYRNSPLAKIAERYRGNKGETEFVRSIRYLLEKEA